MPVSNKVELTRRLERLMGDCGCFLGDLRKGSGILGDFLEGDSYLARFLGVVVFSGDLPDSLPTPTAPVLLHPDPPLFHPL